MAIRQGDTLEKTRQRDGSYNVTIRLQTADGEQLVVTNTKDPDAFYNRARTSADNPVSRDLSIDRDALIKQRDMIDAEISDIDARIAGGGR